MAKAAVLLSVSVIFACVILSKSGILQSLLVFLVVGAVPGTAIDIPPTVMLFLAGAGIWAIVFHFTAGKFISSRQTRRLIKRHTARRQRMPKRRFSQI